MKRRLLATFLSLCLLVGLLPTVALAEEGPQAEPAVQSGTTLASTSANTSDLLSESGTTAAMSGPCGAGENDTVTWELEQNNPGSEPATYTLTISGTGAMADYCQYNVDPTDEKSAAPWMDYRTSITEVEIQEGVTKIGTFAFALCENLETADYPEECVLTRSCFKGCALTSVTVYPGNISLDADVNCSYVFAENEALQSISFEQGILSIPTYYVDQATSLLSVNLAESVQEIGKGAFRGISKDSSGAVIEAENASIEWITQFESVFGPANASAKISKIVAPDQTVTMTLPVGSTIPLFSNISNYIYTSKDDKIVSISGESATTNASGTTTITGTQSGEQADGMTILYDITVSDDVQTIENWDDLTFAFQYGGKYRLESDLSYELPTSTEFADGLLCANGVSVELDLNEHEISFDNIKRAFGTVNGGEISVSNGDISSSAEDLTFIIMRGKNDRFSAQSVTFESSDSYLVHAANNVAISLEDCEIANVTEAVVRDSDNSATVTIIDCDFSGPAIEGTNNDDYDVQVTKIITEGETVTGPLQILPGTTYQLEGGIISGSITVAEGGTLIVNSGEINGTIVTSGSTTITGGTIQKEDMNSDNGVIHIAAGSFNMSGGTVIASGEKARAITFANTGNITGQISGGTFSGSNLALLVQENTNNAVTVTGGKFISASGHIATIIDRQGIIAEGYGVYQTSSSEPETKDTNNEYNGNPSDYTLNVYPIPSEGKTELVISYTAKNARELVGNHLEPSAIDGYTFIGWYSTEDCEFNTQTCGILSDPEDTELVYALFSKKTVTVTPQSEENFGSVKYGEGSPISTPALGHNYQYSLATTTGNTNSAVINEACSLGCNHTATATLTVPTDLVYNGEPKDATVDTTDSWVGDISTITYESNDDALGSAPTDAGTYTASITVGEVTANVEFTIAKASTSVGIETDKDTLSGGGTVTLTVDKGVLPQDAEVNITCDDENIVVTSNQDGTYTAALPNTTATYIFIASYAGNDNYNSASDTCTVSVTRYTSSGGSSSSGSGDAVSISASGGSVTVSQMESAVKKADEGATITIKATSSTTVALPVGGMAAAADNDNDVLLDLRYGEITLSARTIAGMTDGISSNDKIKVSITSQTSSKDETISDLLDKGAAVFDVTVEVDGVEIHSFDGTLTITLTVSNLSRISDPYVLHILTNGTMEYYAPDSISGNTITVKGIRNLSTFAVIPGSEVPQNNPFVDVSTSDYYYDAVLWAVENGVTNGTSATTFSPDMAVSRAQMVTFLWRAHGSPKATGANPFTDVSTSDYYYDAVLWAVANGVTNGTSATTFSPDMAVTRAQAVTFQWRAAGSPVVSGSSFSDVAADAYYVNAVTWAVANGITNGTGGNTFSPDVVVSRAQAVTFLYREQE